MTSSLGCDFSEGPEGYKLLFLQKFALFNNQHGDGDIVRDDERITKQFVQFRLLYYSKRTRVVRRVFYYF